MVQQERNMCQQADSPLNDPETKRNNEMDEWVTKNHMVIPNKLRELFCDQKLSFTVSTQLLARV